MKSVLVEKSGMYYHDQRKETVFLEEGPQELDDCLADVVVEHEGGEYCDPSDYPEVEKKKDPEKEVEKAPEDDSDSKPVDYSTYNMTGGAIKLAKEKELTAEFLNSVKGTGTEGRITKEDLEDAIVASFDEDDDNE